MVVWGQSWGRLLRPPGSRHPGFSPSQSDIGFGKLETYVKLDKLGEVGDWVPRHCGSPPWSALHDPCPGELPAGRPCSLVQPQVVFRGSWVLTQSVRMV